MNLVERVKNILLLPVAEWGTIKGETHTTADLFTRYAMILAAIPALAGLIGFGLIGVSTGTGPFRLPFGYGLIHCILTYVFSLVSVYLLAMIIDFLSPKFGASQSMETALKISVFSMTPAWIGGIFLIIPSLSIISMIAGLYGLYLLFLGIKQLKDVPEDKLLTFFIATVVLAIVIQFIFYTVIRAIAFRGPMM